VHLKICITFSIMNLKKPNSETLHRDYRIKSANDPPIDSSAAAIVKQIIKPVLRNTLTR
jgi:hypothetical protein